MVALVLRATTSEVKPLEWSPQRLHQNPPLQQNRITDAKLRNKPPRSRDVKSEERVLNLHHTRPPALFNQPLKRRDRPASYILKPGNYLNL